MSDNMDVPYDDSDYDNHDMYDTFMERLKEINKVSTKKYEANKYYIGSNSIFGRDWGHPTLTGATVHATKLMEADGLEETFIVKIVRVVRKKVAPVEVIEIK